MIQHVCPAVRGTSPANTAVGFLPLCTQQARQEASLLDGWTSTYFEAFRPCTARAAREELGPLSIHRSRRVEAPHRSSVPRRPVQRHAQHASSKHLGEPGTGGLAARGVASAPGWFIHHFSPFHISQRTLSLTVATSLSCGGSTPAGADAWVGGPGGAVEAVVVPHPGVRQAAEVAAGP